MPPPQARGKAALVARVLGETHRFLLAVGDVAEAVYCDVCVCQRHALGREGVLDNLVLLGQERGPRPYPRTAR